MDIVPNPNRAVVRPLVNMQLERVACIVPNLPLLLSLFYHRLVFKRVFRSLNSPFSYHSSRQLMLELPFFRRLLGGISHIF